MTITSDHVIHPSLLFLPLIHGYWILMLGQQPSPSLLLVLQPTVRSVAGSVAGLVNHRQWIQALAQP